MIKADELAGMAISVGNIGTISTPSVEKFTELVDRVRILEDRLNRMEEKNESD